MFQFFIIKYLAFFLGCLFCFLLHEGFAVPAVIASSIVGLIATFIPFPVKFKNHPYAAAYAGSFAGMCSTDLINSYWELGIISLLGALLYIAVMNLFEGFGGKLGSVAFISVALYVIARGLVQ